MAGVNAGHRGDGSATPRWSGGRASVATSPYAVFSRFYDQLTSGFWDQHARTLDVLLPGSDHSGRRALDLACGTGTGIGYLESRGYTAVGVDLSPNMLAVARLRWPGGQFVHADMRDLPAFPAFDVVICCFDSINYLKVAAEWRRLFREVRGLLAAGGVFVFDSLLPNDLIESWPDHCRVLEHPGLFYTERCAFDPASGIGTTYRVFFADDGSRWYRHDERHEQVAFAPGEIVGWLQEAGFEQVRVHGGEIRDGTDPSGTRVVFRARVAGEAPLTGCEKRANVIAGSAMVITQIGRLGQTKSS